MKKLWMGTVAVPRTRAALSAVWKGVMRRVSQIRPPVKVREDIARITCGPAAAAPTHEKIFIRRFRTMNTQRKGILAGVATVLIATMRAALSAVGKGVVRRGSQIRPPVKVREDIARITCGPAAAAPTHEKIFIRRFRTMNRQRKGILAGVATALIATMMVFVGCPDETPTTYNYICANGTPVSGTATTENTERCQSCASGYTLSGTAGVDGTTCVQDAVDTTKPTFSVAPMVDSSTDTGATVTLTASEAGKVFWVLYADGTAAPTAAALIIAASGDSAGEQRSGANDAVTAAEKTVPLTTLTASTTYDFYAVLQDSAGNVGAISAKVEITTTAAVITDTTKPTFSVAPAVDGDETATTATVKFTASEAGKVFWVLYADSTADAPSPDDLITAASGSTIGVKQSGANDAVTTAEKTVTIAGLTPGTTYNFYAVLQDSAGNKGTVSAKVVVTTAAAADVTPPAFASGKAPAVDGRPTANGATVKFTATEAGKVFWVLYADSTADAPSPDDLITAASGSTIGVKQSGANDAVTTAEKTVTITGLIAGITYDFYAVLQDSAGNNGAVSHKLVVTTSSTASYICTNGTAKTGNPAGSTDVVACQTCESGYTPTGTLGEENTDCTDKTPPAFASGKAPAVDGRPTANGATVKFTATEAGKVFWVLYASTDASPDNAADLIADASGSTVGVKQSGDSVAVTSAEKTVTIAGLTPGTTYNFYAVLQDSAANNGALSAKVVITTAAAADKTPPAFASGKAPAVEGSATANGATVKFTATEAGKVFWILYADGTPVPTDVAAFIAAAADGNTGVQQSGDSVAVTATEKNGNTDWPHCRYHL